MNLITALRKFLFSLVALIWFAGLEAQPIISGITPQMGPVGTSVTINGSGFDPSTNGNLVYFGTVRAIVTAASTTSLQVSVPAGFAGQLFTVTTAGLTTEAAEPFIVTFTGGGPFSAGSFAPKVDIPAPGTTWDIAAGDLNGDGKPELVSANFNASSISVFTNACTATSISFPTKTDFATQPGPVSVELADLDGDGMPDIIVGNTSTPEVISVFRNTSSGVTISFAPRIDYNVATYSGDIAVGDLDGDGKPEIVATNNQNLVLLRNNSTISTILFAPPVYIPAGIATEGIVIKDINANGRPDIITTNNTTLKFLVFDNTSTMGSISFAPFISFTTPDRPIDVTVGDLDSDHQPDLAISFESSLIRVYKNTGSGNGISFTEGPVLNVQHAPYDVGIYDLNGNGQPDIVCSNFDGSATVSVFRNITNGALSFDQKVDFPIGANNRQMAIADLTGDGKPDLATITGSSNTISVRRNKIGEPPALTSFTPAVAGEGTVVTINGSNIADVTAVSFGGVPAAAFTVVNDNKITARVSIGASGTVSVTTLAGIANFDGFTFSPRPSINSFLPAAGPIGQHVKIVGTNFGTTPSENIVFFGATRALVNSASATELNVTVPPGATYEPISVTRNNITAWSNKPFNVTFPNGRLANDTSFVYTTQLETGLDGTIYSALADIDGDGKPDIITHDYGSDVMAVWRNTTVNGILSFTGHIFPAPMNSNPYNVTVGDVDGDGKPDIMVPCQWTAAVRIYRNTSVPGTISFTFQNVFTGQYPNQIAFGDLDGDGKAEMLVGNESSPSISVFKNTSPSGSIAFTGSPGLSTIGVGNLWLQITDIDGDGKNDVVAGNSDSHVFSVFRNTSQVGLISTAGRIDFPVDHVVSYVSAADLDNDGKPEVVLGLGGYNSTADSLLEIYKNISTPGNIAFATKKKYHVEIPLRISPADLDGDGKPDLGFAIVNPQDDEAIMVLRNTSDANGLSFEEKRIVNLESAVPTIQNPNGLSFGDIDGDNRPDMLLLDQNLSTFSFFINYTGSERPFCGNTNDSIGSDRSGIMYRWMVQVPGGTYQLVSNNANYSGANTQVLHLNNIPPSWSGYKYRCLVNPTFSTFLYSKEYTLRLENHWTGAVNSTWENPANWSCGVVPDNNTNVVIDSGTIVISSNVTIHSLRLDPDASLNVMTGYTLTVTN